MDQDDQDQTQPSLPKRPCGRPKRVCRQIHQVNALMHTYLWIYELPHYLVLGLTGVSNNPGDPVAF